MLGVVLTLVAVFVVICFAFYFSDSPSDRGPHADALYFAAKKNRKRDDDRSDLA